MLKWLFIGMLASAFQTLAQTPDQFVIIEDDMTAPPQVFQEISFSDGYLMIKQDVHDFGDRNTGCSESQSRLILKLPYNGIDSIYSLEPGQIAVEYFYSGGLMDLSSHEANYIDLVVSANEKYITVNGTMSLNLDPNPFYKSTKKIGLKISTPGELTNNRQEYKLSQQSIIPEEDDNVHQFTDLEPEFPGGQEEMLSFIKNNIQYPQSARDMDIQGRVFVSIVIEKDGAISNVKVIKSVFSELDTEAKRVVSRMPNWIPGEVRGEKVRSRVYLPVLFKID